MTEVLSVSKQLHDFIDDLEKCIQYEYGSKIDCDNIVLCGMGGSAISGNVVADYCLERTDKPVVSIMNASLPNWVNERTLVIISSYSGNTLESLEAYKHVLRIGCKRVIITSGGLLKDLADKNGDPIIMLPGNYHPRHSIGYMIGYIFGVIRAACPLNIKEEILAVIDSVRDYRDRLEDRINSPAMEMARHYIDYIPVICSYSNIQSIIFRWKTQINENAKYVAFCTTMSEFVYSDLKGWVNNRRSNYILTIIVDDEKKIRDEVYVSKLIVYLRDHNVPYHLISLGGKTPMENMLRALILGDYISMYMAELQGIDPSGVPPIDSLKRKLKDLREECLKDVI